MAYDHKVATSSHHARILWLSGRPDEAAGVIEMAAEDAQRLGQPFAFGFFLVCGACPVAFWRGDLAAARHYVAQLRDVASGMAFNVWQGTGRLFETALGFLAAPVPAVPPDALIANPRLTDFQAQTLATFDWRLLGAHVSAQALRGPENWSTAEILRARGETLLAAKGPRGDAEALFRRAIGIARAQGAKAWELRAATSLARLLAKDGKRMAAREALGRIHAQFSEGAETQDLREAAVLLKTLE